ncbi:hypothetical protein [Calothrix sp. NIES-2098]|uniref:hypothetical protein n=1 Tax=Calothrix sp. NIES-2098 TaxID=1954171 RepID=UPI0030DBFEB7
MDTNLSLRVERRRLEGGFPQGSGAKQSQPLRLLPLGRNDGYLNGYNMRRSQ